MGQHDAKLLIEKKEREMKRERERSKEREEKRIAPHRCLEHFLIHLVVKERILESEILSVCSYFSKDLKSDGFQVIEGWSRLFLSSLLDFFLLC